MAKVAQNPKLLITGAGVLLTVCEDYHSERKYAIKPLNGTLAPPSGRAHPVPDRRYELVEPVVHKVWLTAEQPCGKRLAPILRQAAVL